MSTEDHHFSNSSRSPVPEDLCKDKAQGLILFWRRRFLKVFTIYGHSSHLGQWTALISFPQPKEAPHKIWATLDQRLRRRSRLKFSTFFQNIWCPYKCIGKQIWPRCKKVKRQCTTIILTILVDLPSLVSCAKIQPHGILCSGEEDFLRFLPYMGIAAILVNGPRSF